MSSKKSAVRTHLALVVCDIADCFDASRTDGHHPRNPGLQDLRDLQNQANSQSSSNANSNQSS
ncbi:MAG: hypothetical protein ACRCXZ_04945 [Patescibacteria group bacterium]